jgi:hypothetical protein
MMECGLLKLMYCIVFLEWAMLMLMVPDRASAVIRNAV